MLIIMNTNIDKVSDAWRKAGEELNIRVIAPYTIQGSDGKDYCFAAYLPDFGGRKGAVLIAAEPPKFECSGKVLECAKNHGYWHSILSCDCYSIFDKDSFIATLDDFQYFGEPGNQPNWYTGKPWT